MSKLSPHTETLSLENFLPYRLSIASNQVSELIASTYRNKYGLSVAEWRLITILAETGASTPRDLVHLSKMDKVTVSRAAVRLSRAGFVSKRANPGDGRSHHLKLTRRGLSIYRDVTPRVRVVEAELLNRFTKAETQFLSKLLRRLQDAAEDQSLSSGT